jgi:hypothetical protein
MVDVAPDDLVTMPINGLAAGIERADPLLDRPEIAADVLHARPAQA